MKTLSSEKVFSGKIIQVYKDQVLLENGIRTEREVVRHRDAAAVVAINDRNEILMVRQYRYAIAQEQLEIPAGLLDEGETPLEAARRELLEETGYKAAHWQQLLSVFMSPGAHDEEIHIFLATDLRAAGRQSLDEDELLTLETVPLDTVLHDIEAGRIKDGKTVTGILAYRLIARG